MVQIKVPSGLVKRIHDLIGADGSKKIDEGQPMTVEEYVRREEGYPTTVEEFVQKAIQRRLESLERAGT